jgi:hypothetical protein
VTVEARFEAFGGAAGLCVVAEVAMVVAIAVVVVG